MSVGLRTVLIVISVLTMMYIVRKIRQSKLDIEHALFWIGFSVLLIFMSIFPKLVYWLTDLIGIQSPVNFVFLAIIFILILKNFMMTIQLSELDNKLKNLVQEMALKYERKKEDEDA